jgi:ribosome maturation factor RimP
MSANTAAKAAKIVEPVVKANGLDLYDVEYVKEGRDWLLRVYIDKEDSGVSILDCERVSRALEKVLDEHDPIPGSYILEVGSPGIDRALKKDADFEKYSGRLIDIKLYKPADKRKNYRGTLIGRRDGMVRITDENGAPREFDMRDIASVRLAIEGF